MNNPFDTHITRYLTEQGISYRLLPHQTPAKTIEDAAKQRGIHPKQMVKSIVLKELGGRYVLACVPGDKAVDPKKVRAIFQGRRMTCVNVEEVALITGYQVGTVTPLQLLTSMPIVFDLQLLNEQQVTISSGTQMAGIALRSQDLVALCHPIITDIVR